MIANPAPRSEVTMYTVLLALVLSQGPGVRESLGWSEEECLQAYYLGRAPAQQQRRQLPKQKEREAPGGPEPQIVIVFVVPLRGYDELRRVMGGPIRHCEPPPECIEPQAPRPAPR